MSPSKDQEWVNRLADHLRAQQGGSVAEVLQKPETNGHLCLAGGTAAGSTDEQVLKMCRAADSAPKFADLYDHADVHTHHGGDESSADLGLIGMMRYWTQDPAQLERLFSTSALGQRDKWRRRADYRARTINAALSGDFETYDWAVSKSRPMGQIASSSSLPFKAGDDDDAKPDHGLELVTFKGRPAPKEQEFIVPGLIPRFHATTLYGWGGTAKSLLALMLGLCVASGKEEYFGKPITTHGPVLYIDFELGADEQHRRVERLVKGMGMEEPPEGLKYVSTLGVRTHVAVDFATKVCRAQRGYDPARFPGSRNDRRHVRCQRYHHLPQQIHRALQADRGNTDNHRPPGPPGSGRGLSE
jgi:AAA domain-containing protein/primase/DNA polymerase family protein